MRICSLRNDNLLSCCVYSDILNRKFPPKKPFRPENSDCVECATFSLPRIKFNLSSGVFERRTATGSKTSSFFLCLDAKQTLIFISQTTDFHFASYRLSFRKLQIAISQTTDCHFANYRFSFRKLQIVISQTTDSHFANYSRSASFRFANYSKP